HTRTNSPARRYAASKSARTGNVAVAPGGSPDNSPLLAQPLNITAMVSPARVKMRMVFLPYWCNVGIMHHTRSADRNRHVRRSAGATDMRGTLLGGFLDVLPATFDVFAGARNRIAPRRNGCNGEQDRKQNSVLHGFLLGKVGDVTRHAAAGLQYAGRSNHAPFPGKLPIGQAA